MRDLRRNIVIASIVLGSVLLSGCNNEGPVEHYIGVSPEGYEDTVKLSGVKKNNYSGYFLGEGITIETALDLSNESLNSLCYGWNWELSDKKYNGDAINLEEGESEELWGVEREVEREENLEEAKDEEDSTDEAKSDTEGVKKDGEGEAENEEAENEEGEGKEDKKEEEPEEVETEIVVETSGSVETLAEITGSELILKSGQVLTVLPNYIEPVVEEIPEEGSTGGNAEGEPEEGSNAEGEAESKGNSPEEGSEEITEDSETVEEEEKEPPAEVVKAIKVTNYSNENRTVKSCVESGWFTLQLDNYVDCFGMKPLETEEEIPNDEVFTRLSESFGNPTIIWEQPTNSENYAKGVYQMIYSYEFPEYTLIAGVVGDNINTMYYLPKGIWLGNKEYVGMKALYSSSYIEIDKSELPEIEDAE